MNELLELSDKDYGSIKMLQQVVTNYLGTKEKTENQRK